MRLWAHALLLAEKWRHSEGSRVIIDGHGAANIVDLIAAIGCVIK